VGTAKRERQKANRQMRLEELAKQARKEKSKRFGLRIAIGIGAVIALVGLIYLVGGDDDKSTTAATTTTTADPTVTTVDPNAPTTTAPPKPEISLPAEPVTELKVTTITEGTGDPSVVGDLLDVHYLGYTSVDGVEFDNSYDRGEPFQLTLGAGMVIDGWDQGLVGVQVGGRYQIDIPVDLAYGPDAAASGRPEGALTFIVDIMAITPGTTATATT
jgi:peptidylprolyl isomerase